MKTQEYLFDHVKKHILKEVSTDSYDKIQEDHIKSLDKKISNNSVMEWKAYFDANINEAKDDLNKNNYDYADDKNIDNLNGEEFKLGVNFEMTKVEELLTNQNLGEYIKKARAEVAKNLAKNPLHYIEKAQFGQEGIGYTADVPGLKPTEIKGKYVESGYGDATKKVANDKFVEVKENKISFKDLLND